MNTEEFVWNMNYIADRLEETSQSAQTILEKSYLVPYQPLTIEERYLLRHVLHDLCSYAGILKEDVKTFENTQKDPFWRKLLRK